MTRHKSVWHGSKRVCGFVSAEMACPLLSFIRVSQSRMFKDRYEPVFLTRSSLLAAAAAFSRQSPPGDQAQAGPASVITHVDALLSVDRRTNPHAMNESPSLRFAGDLRRDDSDWSSVCCHDKKFNRSCCCQGK